MNGLERFAQETTHPEELIRPVTGDHLLLVHFFGMFPSRAWQSGFRTELYYNLTKNNSDFLDLRFTKQQMKGNKPLMMWLIDDYLRRTYHSEEAALLTTDNAIEAIQQPSQNAAGITFSSNRQDYFPMFEVASPIYRELKNLRQFSFSDFFS